MPFTGIKGVRVRKTFSLSLYFDRVKKCGSIEQQLRLVPFTMADATEGKEVDDCSSSESDDESSKAWSSQAATATPPKLRRKRAREDEESLQASSDVELEEETRMMMPTKMRKCQVTDFEKVEIFIDPNFIRVLSR